VCNWADNVVTYFGKGPHDSMVGDDTNYGPRVHYVHVVRDGNGQIKEVYRYYLDLNNKPVLDGTRSIRRWEHDPGLILEYKDGRIVRKYRAIVTG
jgi:hypothetical protein